MLDHCVNQAEAVGSRLIQAATLHRDAHAICRPGTRAKLSVISRNRSQLGRTTAGTLSRHQPKASWQAARVRAGSQPKHRVKVLGRVKDHPRPIRQGSSGARQVC